MLQFAYRAIQSDLNIALPVRSTGPQEYLIVDFAIIAIPDSIIIVIGQALALDKEIYDLFIYFY